MKWVHVKAIPEKHDCQLNTIYLPANTAFAYKEITLEFGLKRVKAQVKVGASKQHEQINHKNANQTMLVSHSLIEEACLVTTQVYQMNIIGNTIQLGPVIGLLLGEQQYYYHHSFMQEYTDAMKRANEIGGLVVAFKLCSIDWKSESIYGLYYNLTKARWEYARCPIPTVVFRRAFNSEDNNLKRLKTVVGKNFFNETKLDKLEMYEKFNKYADFEPYLPETAKLTTSSFNSFIEKYDKVILKPVDLSRGRGICIVHRDGKQISILDSVEDAIPIKIIVSEEQAQLYFTEKGFYTKKYLIQPFLSLSKINGSPWDIRMIMQKNEKFQWQCNGIECRLAGAFDYLTNISRGGRALTINQAIKLSQGPQADVAIVKKKLLQAAMEFCSIMDEGVEHFGEFGMDFALDEHQNCWFIEANVRPTFNGFKKIDYNNYYHICSAPLLYATKLAGFKRRRKNE